MILITPNISKSEPLTIQTTLPCHDTKEIINVLRKQYKEFPFSLGKANDDAESIMSLWVNPTSKSWTILATKNDITCVIGTGENFELVPYKDKSKFKT